MNARACILALLASACGPSTCGGGVATPPAPPPRGPTDAPAEWPETDHALPNAMPATSIAVTRDAITVSNEGLIASWPSADRARAAGDPPEGEPRWPIVTRRIERPGAEGALLPALGEALALTRRAERAATGLGSGASQCNLRIAIDVPFEHVQRVLYTLGVAGYASPRVLYGAGGSDRALALVPSPARGATPEEVAAALARIAPGAPSAPSPAAAPA
ncbi:MAG: hypothetical protein IT378_03235, partial [Sandaracinaceae bacterium]|nr:hypothetical protein [Sandaracinaceae bacterium]